MSPSNEKLVHQWWKCSLPFQGRSFIVLSFAWKTRSRATLNQVILPYGFCPRGRGFYWFYLPTRWGATRFPHGRSKPPELAPAGDVVWPPRSPSLTPYDFLLWGKVFVAVQARSLAGFKKRITPATASLSRDAAKSLRRVGLPSRHLPSDT